MVNYCCVRNCRNNNKYNPRLNFFSVPRDPKSEMDWLRLIGREEWIFNKPKSLTSASKRVCSAHFSPNLISGIRLKKQAVPDRFDRGVGFRAVRSRKEIEHIQKLMSEIPSTSADHDQNLGKDCSTPDATILDDCSSEESSKVSTVSTQTDGEYKEYKETIKVLNTKNESLKKRVEELEQTLASFKKIFGV